MRIYIAHNYDCRDFLKGTLIPDLVAAGHEVTSRWITDPEHELYGPNNEAEVDLQDVWEANVLVLFVDQCGDRPGRGKYVELGLALAWGKPVVLVGKAEDCVFYRLNRMTRLATIQDLVDWAQQNP